MNVAEPFQGFRAPIATPVSNAFGTMTDPPMMLVGSKTATAVSAGAGRAVAPGGEPFGAGFAAPRPGGR